MANDSAGICSMDNVKFLPELLFKYIETIPERNYYQIAYVPAVVARGISLNLVSLSLFIILLCFFNRCLKYVYDL
nr:hypothetical protein Iba_chr01eCG7380 [Ipomoea batatas]GMD07535.1 hypothetical protein Iba_chr06cCG8170 [Ipomoea batatas]GMD16695.1 hypothetical protein Iba_chr07cCG11900 [Ipomoea batatas]GMD60569.1 hypothetical protein Iba_chr12aCG12480 [Ipomoea batatas]GMD87177.1 hypothetical protein Iba_chr14bCG13210 [Ipomoea batatas]